MTVLTLPELPEVFADCARNIALYAEGSGFVDIEQLLDSHVLEDGFSGLMRRWRPGDQRAVVSLWTQGYFGRLFRPILAYGVLHDIWFRTRLQEVRVALSEISTPVRFALEPASPGPMREHFDRLIREHAEPLIERLVARTGTAERLHWSNASFAFYRACSQIAALSSAPDVVRRMAEVRDLQRNDHPMFRLTRIEDHGCSEERLARRVCCIRFKLDNLKKCAAACPTGAER